MGVVNLTGATYQAFLDRSRFVVVLLDAPGWNKSGARMRDVVFPSAAALLGSQATFGFVDIDAEPDVAQAVRLMNVPTVAYYRDGVVVAAWIGANQDVTGRTLALINGLPIL